MGLTAAENTFLLSGFVLTGFAVYLLLDRLGLDPLASIYAGYVVAFNPWMIERAYAGHHGYMHAWVFPVSDCRAAVRPSQAERPRCSGTGGAP